MTGSGGLDEIRTKIAGTTMGAEAETRMAALAALAALTPEERVGRLELETEWDNPYDSDAIRVFALVPNAAGTIERLPLGFIKNSDTICDLCGWAYGRFPKRCSRCGHSDHLRRDGAATRISAAMRAEPDRRFWAEILDVTGGTEGKENRGCNIIVRSLVRPPGPGEGTKRGIVFAPGASIPTTRELGDIWPGE